jgi:hypothetical protein
MSVNFNDLLSRPVSSAKKPPLKPAGTYTAIISSYILEVSKRNKTPYVRFTLNNLQPTGSIPEAQCKDTDGEPINFSKWTPHKDFFITDDSIYRLRNFIEDLGLPIEGRSFEEVLPEMRGQAVLVEVTHVTSEDGTNVYANVSDVTAQRD